MSCALNLSSGKSHDDEVFLYFHLILTDDCNLCCTYCRARLFENPEVSVDSCTPRIEIDPLLPPELDFNLDLLYSFLQKDPAPTLTFYGGEPLLRADLITRIVREAPVHRFMMQTNGILLDRLSPEIINCFLTILVSLDGREGLTDANRGPGMYRRVMENIKKIRREGFRQELIARMTVNEIRILLMQSTGFLITRIIRFPLFTGNWMQIFPMIFHIAVLKTG